MGDPSLFDSLDGIDALDERIGNADDFQAIYALMTQMVPQASSGSRPRHDS
ncbi:hypothetical protein [Mycolicibacterium baixiangningiae]|uniref:hypothetical protein n=1 Tax=Mycolicibacterium baixiangningiae TaxID=2761578 RepID=UPI0018D18312|nr:hypothetical protein [Mycolicibacterium baixiangningiae]